MLERRLTEEDIANMSPEEMAELQRQQCIFCKIIKGEIPSKKVYEDDICIAILDINPANTGHMLLLPKNHYAIMPQMSEDEINHMGIIAKYLSQAALRAFGAQGTNIFIANGVIAGQRAPHFMVHIIPRKEKDGVVGFEIPELRINEEEIEKIRKTILEKSGIEIIKEESKKEDKDDKIMEIKKQENEKGKKDKEDIESKAKNIENKAQQVDINLLAKMFKK